MARTVGLLKGVSLVTIDVIDQTESYPYTAPAGTLAVSVANLGADTVTVEFVSAAGTFEVDLTTDVRVYDGYFDGLDTVNVTAGTTYQIEFLKGRSA